jgi:hypothetical protein
LGYILGRNPSQTEPYVIPSHPFTQIIGIAATIRTVLIILFIIIGLLWWITTRKRAHKTWSSLSIAMTLFLVGLVHTAAYAFYGHFSLRFLLLIYPIVAVILVGRITKGNISKYILPSILVCLAVVQSISFIGDYDGKSNYSTVKPSAHWLTNFGRKNPTIISDFNSTQIIQYYYLSNNQSISPVLFNSDIYRYLVIPNSKSEISNFDYFVVNELNIDNPTVSSNWRSYEPLNKYVVNINKNYNLRKIYEDKSMTIFQNK